MHELKIPSTRALSIVGSDMEIYREEIETAAILLRVAPSFIRFGHFEVFASRGQHNDVQALADYLLLHHYAHFLQSQHPYRDLFRQIVSTSASLIALWQAVGFMHGVMNTDNMSIHGLTIDYGPFGFMDGYNPEHICNHTDTQGRYAFNKQPGIGLWNLTCLAEAFSTLVEREELREILDSYENSYVATYIDLMRSKLGLYDEHQKDDISLINDFLNIMKESQADYTNTFRALSELNESEASVKKLQNQFINTGKFNSWLIKYLARLDSTHMDRDQLREKMKQQNPKYILRNYLLQEAIEKAQQKDYTEIETLLKLIQRPYDEHEGFDDYTRPPPQWASQIQVSCSS